MILNPLGVFEDEEEEKENEEEDDIEPIPVFPPGMAPPKPEVRAARRALERFLFATDFFASGPTGTVS